MATVHEEILVHPTQASRVRLRVFDRPPEPAVAGMGPDQGGFLVTEERIGARTVVNTLGFLGTQDEAIARLRARAAELARQQYRSLASIPPAA
jgi:hypothetical protein